MRLGRGAEKKKKEKNLKQVSFSTVAVDTSGRICADFLHAHREASFLANDILEESGHFRFLRAACLGNIKGSVGEYRMIDSREKTSTSIFHSCLHTLSAMV